MKFVCANCGQKFKIADETKSAFEFTCTSCGAAFKVDIAEEPIIVHMPPKHEQQPAAPASAKMQLPNGKAQLKANFLADISKPPQAKQS